MDHLYKVYPKTDISGLLPGNKRITDPVIMKLNKKEFIKCMNAGSVYAIVNGAEVLVEEKDYEKAESMFDYIDTDAPNESENSDEMNTEMLELKNNNSEHKDKYQNEQINQSSSKRSNKRNRRR